jgi:hypothetical protein
LLLTKPGRLVRVAVAEAEGDRAAAVVAVGAEAEDDRAVVVVAVGAEAEAGTVTAVIAAAEAAETAAGNSRQQSKVARKPGSIDAPRFQFPDCQGSHYGLCFP